MPKCKKLSENAEAAAKEPGVEYEMEKKTDINAIMEFGVMMTPAMAVDGQVKVVGKIPDMADIKKLLS
ncbi:MAG: thioredoxin family protein [Bryobacteraceae bacterium]